MQRKKIHSFDASRGGRRRRLGVRRLCLCFSNRTTQHIFHSNTSKRRRQSLRTPRTLRVPPKVNSNEIFYSTLLVNPMKLIFIGAKISDEKSQLNEAIKRTHKWASHPDRTIGLEEALQMVAPRRAWNTCRRTHLIFTLDRLKAH